MAAAMPSAAQPAPCLRLAEQLLEQLREAPSSSSIEAVAETQRQILIAAGCDPQATGYDLAVEELKLNAELKPSPDPGPAIRLDELLRIEY
jgi:hypothetical protein